MRTTTSEGATTVDAEGFAIVLPPHLIANFERADRQIQQEYGITPGVPLLVRLWLACGRASHIRREFELAALGKTNSGHLLHNDDIDGDDI